MSTAAEPSRRPSIADVASRAGVSKAAVSKVIRDAYGVSPAMQARVQAAITQLGYRPRVAARAMRGASFTIGFEVPDLVNEFMSQILDGAAGALSGSGYQLIIAPRAEPATSEAALESLIDRQVDGVIGIASDLTSDSLRRFVAEVPFVTLGRHDRSVDCDSVTGDNAVGTDLVMDHLLALGHREITHLTIRTARHDHSLSPRLRGYRRRMRQAGLVPQVVFTDDEESASETVAALLRSGSRPTAIFAGYDTLAIGALRALAEAGVDSEVSVVGYDGTDLSGHPLLSLTTVDQFGREMGAIAIALLLERIRGSRTTPIHRCLAPELRIRRSTRPVPRAVGGPMAATG